MRARSLRLPLVVALIGCSAALGACGSSTSSDSGSGTTGASGSGAPELSGQTAVVETFGGEFDKQIRRHYLKPVEEETGLKASISNPTDYGQLATQVKTGNVQWTVVQGDPFFSIANCGTLLEPMASKVDRSQIQPRYVTDECEVAGETYNFLLVYNKKDFGSNPPTSWTDFFDTEKFPGNRGIWGSYVFNGALEAARLAEGVAPDQLYPLDVSKALAKLESIKPETKFFETLGQAQQLMEAEEVSMIIVPGEIGVQVDKNGGEWAPVWNQQLVSWDAYFAPKGADSAAAAAILSRIATSDAQSAVIAGDPTSGVTTKTFTAPKPTGVEALFSPDIDNRAAKGIDLDQQWWAKNMTPVGERWTQYVSG